MRAIYVDEKINYSEYYIEPFPKEGEIIIKLSYVKVIKLYENTLEYYFVGEVHHGKGDFITGKKVFGVIRDTNLIGEYICCKINQVKLLEENIEDVKSLFILPIARVLKIIHTTHIGPKDEITIIGSEELAQLANKLLSYSGCYIMRITRCLNEGVFILKNNLVLFVEDVSKINKSQVVIECTGSLQGIDTAKKIVKRNGTLILKNSYSDVKNINPVLWDVKNLVFLNEENEFIHGAMRILVDNKFSISDILGEIYTLKNYKTAFQENTTNFIFKLGT